MYRPAFPVPVVDAPSELSAELANLNDLPYEGIPRIIFDGFAPLSIQPRIDASLEIIYFLYF